MVDSNPLPSARYHTWPIGTLWGSLSLQVSGSGHRLPLIVQQAFVALMRKHVIKNKQLVRRQCRIDGIKQTTHRTTNVSFLFNNGCVAFYQSIQFSSGTLLNGPIIRITLMISLVHQQVTPVVHFSGMSVSSSLRLNCLPLSPVPLNLRPYLGNGFVATQPGSPWIFLDGFFDGYTTESHRACIPSPLCWSAKIQSHSDVSSSTTSCLSETNWMHFGMG
ncbi:hypothetical protein D915_010547 [Fasciola hepatica]|uniref:Uncharacterized protein n=1 Tax=Fasciola hepatica TaxID=6192 RepID=A0A4E0RBC4_FASHE|nr:hypothetical protein D915_010547 [Fasciola hepatica]